MASVDGALDDGSRRHRWNWLGGLVGSDRNARRTLLGLAALALGIRLLVAIEVSDGYVPLTDAADFQRWAQSLAEEGRFPSSSLEGVEGPTAFRAPAYPVLLAVLYVIVGTDIVAGLVLNAVLGAAASLLVGVLGWLVWDRRVGVVVGALAAIHPTMILFGSGLQLEPLLMCAILGSLICAFRFRSCQHAGWLIGAGLLFGLALLTREIAWPLLLVNAALMAGAIDRTRRGVRLRIVFTYAAIAGLVVLPWFVRNLQQFGEPVLISTSPNVALSGTYNEQSRQLPEAPWVIANDVVLDTLAAAGAEGELAVADELAAQNRSFIQEHPTYVAKAAFWNLVRLFDLQGTEHATAMARFTPYPPRLNQIAVYSSYAMGLLAIAGILHGAHGRMPRYVWLFPLAAITTTVLVFGMIRYRAAIEPFTLLLAGAGIVGIGVRYFGLPPPAGDDASTTA